LPASSRLRRSCGRRGGRRSAPAGQVPADGSGLAYVHADHHVAGTCSASPRRTTSTSGSSGTDDSVSGLRGGPDLAPGGLRGLCSAASSTARRLAVDQLAHAYLAVNVFSWSGPVSVRRYSGTPRPCRLRAPAGSSSSRGRRRAGRRR
jgi:hypothetical protein